MSILHEFGGGVEIPGAAVVAEALPCVQDVVFARARKRGESRETCEPSIIVRQHGRHLRLLEHELRDENRVRIARAAPREIAPVFAIPDAKRGTKRRNIDCRFEWDHDLLIRT
ncbi:MAG: hypothetical protein QOG48_2137 [Verrucomicrobiota bacterium]